MNAVTYFTLSVEKGIRGNIGRKPEFVEKNGDSFVDVMLFLIPNGDKNNEQFSQIVNVHFPKEALKELREFGQGDYVRIKFDRIDLAKSISKKTEVEMLYITVKANSIELIRKAPEKEAKTPVQEKEITAANHRRAYKWA